MSEKYRQAGVDLEAATESVSRITPHVKRTHRPGVMGALGGFGGLFSLREAGFEAGHGGDETVLVSATDGVGTKLKLAFQVGVHDTVGVDCVAMCVNDVLTTGAEPLLFLDYIATGALDPAHVEAIVSGIAEGCVQAGCALVGGETAEMPGFYADGEYDIAGFCVGAARRVDLLDPQRDVRAGDQLVAFASSGVHSNGYSLVRKIIRDHDLDLDQPRAADAAQTLGEELMTPTRIYTEAFKAAREHLDIHAAAHITGGGLVENVPRALPDTLAAHIDTSSWQTPALFEHLCELGEVEARERHEVFNMGVGLVLIVAPDEALEQKLEALQRALGYAVWRLGEITTREEDGDGVIFA